MSFQLSPHVDKNKVFLVNLSEIEGRLDPFCYIPELVRLDKKIKSKTKYRLRNFSKSHSSGATPNKSDDSYYSDPQHGIPFIRVQNLSVNGELDQSDLVYIARETHEGLLKRSQVKEHDLLIKITGVGRMAIASVAPDNFEGNINQHIVVIRTGSKEISENIAAFLNLDSAEKLATKRATGGTRPALDYPALFSMPVINDRRIYEKIQSSLAIKKQKEKEAQRSLDSIDDYLLGELGINLIEPEENTIHNRIFYRKLSEVSGGRFDSEYYHLSHYQDLVDLKKSSFKLKRLVEVCNRIVDGPFGSSIKAKDYVEKGIPFIRVADVTKGEGYLKTDELIFISDEAHQKILRSRVIPSDVVIAKTGATMGAACVVPENIPEANIRGDLAALTVKREQCLPEYVVAFINTNIGQRLFWRLDSGGTRGRVVIGNLEKLPIIIPPLNIQRNIVKRVDEICDCAKQLRQEAEADLEKVKQEVEAMILDIE